MFIYNKPSKEEKIAEAQAKEKEEKAKDLAKINNKRNSSCSDVICKCLIY